MVGTIIKFEEQSSGDWFEIDVTPRPAGDFQIQIFNSEGKDIVKEKVVISKANLAELKSELMHIL